MITRGLDHTCPEAVQARNGHAAVRGPSPTYRVSHWLLYARWSAETRGGVLRTWGPA
jgi:hypothetical protein